MIWSMIKNQKSHWAEKVTEDWEWKSLSQDKNFELGLRGS